MKKRRGNILVLFLFFALAFGLFSKLVFDVGRWNYLQQRLQAVADAALLSSLRIRVDSLQTIAERWNNIGNFVVEGYSNGQILVPATHWTAVERSADALKRAISGYRGRVSAVLSVVLEANQISRESAQLVRTGAQDLGVVVEASVMRDETGHFRNLPGGWYRRRWSPMERLGQPKDDSVYELAVSDFRMSSRGHLRWDVDLDNSQLQTRGNGGFPTNWGDALEGNQVRPHRFPVFSAQLQ